MKLTKNRSFHSSLSSVQLKRWYRIRIMRTLGKDFLKFELKSPIFRAAQLTIYFTVCATWKLKPTYSWRSNLSCFLWTKLVNPCHFAVSYLSENFIRIQPGIDFFFFTRVVLLYPYKNDGLLTQRWRPSENLVPTFHDGFIKKRNEHCKRMGLFNVGFIACYFVTWFEKQTWNVLTGHLCISCSRSSLRSARLL